ncbi:receptor activity-modifying protein 3-like isoform X2 [Brienomyrus brachyistius]|uniref:receptor activity-modifying protein 3-like isoform X2 n=1 Tax=Brienomyrus brachyistius TaxID=42636 RepID=UPI0020B366D4|nr:receptor activity-modifying protein 3-like isoform X2 [Brienomyrus brachyistius]
MDKNTLLITHLFVCWLFVIAMTTRGWSAENINKQKELLSSLDARSQPVLCNETALLLEMERCGDWFKREMELIPQRNWCNLSYFIWKYNHFSNCSEDKAVSTGCYWPNPLVESYIIRVHRLFFSNCTLSHMVLMDPSDNMLAMLIFVPVFLTLAMVALVVWCSKRGDFAA